MDTNESIKGTTNNQQDPGSLREDLTMMSFSEERKATIPRLGNAELGAWLEVWSEIPFGLISPAILEAARRLSSPSDMAARCGEVAKDLEECVIGSNSFFRMYDDQQEAITKALNCLTELSQVPSAGKPNLAELIQWSIDNSANDHQAVARIRATLAGNRRAALSTKDGGSNG